MQQLYDGFVGAAAFCNSMRQPWQSHTSHHTLYKSSAKEKPACRNASSGKDEETNLKYFGAGYGACPTESGNSDLSVWLSMDAYAPEYPMKSSYSYCANSPVILIGLNGQWIERNITSCKNGRQLPKITFRKADGINLNVLLFGNNQY